MTALHGQQQLLDRAPLVCRQWCQLAADLHLWRAHHRTLFLDPSTASGQRPLPVGCERAAARWYVDAAMTKGKPKGGKAIDYRARCAPVVRWLATEGARVSVSERTQWVCERGLAGVVYDLRTS
jgi:hypothetical protein